MMQMIDSYTNDSLAFERLVRLTLPKGDEADFMCLCFVEAAPSDPTRGPAAVTCLYQLAHLPAEQVSACLKIQPNGALIGCHAVETAPPVERPAVAAGLIVSSLQSADTLAQ